MVGVGYILMVCIMIISKRIPTYMNPGSAKNDLLTLAVHRLVHTLG